MKLYTRTGDDGTTGLLGGGRVGKDDVRVEAYGTVDETNACLGLAAAGCDGERAVHRRFVEILGELQSRLFDIGADLATPEASKQKAKIRRIVGEDTVELERWIDEIDGANEAMRSFVLPGGTELAARLHLARTVCRRAERRMVALARVEAVNGEAMKYVNRLGDLLFAMARRANGEAGVGDVAWVSGGKLGESDEATERRSDGGGRDGRAE